MWLELTKDWLNLIRLKNALKAVPNTAFKKCFADWRNV